VRLLVAFSGGVDSVALLAALAGLPDPPASLRAVHVNHGLHPRAGGWAHHCRLVARRLHVSLSVRKADVRRDKGLSLEEAARRARYQVLATELGQGEILLTAHHQDDQLETVLLQLLRGAGVRGLAAMPECAPFAASLLVRPLLSRSRSELESWVRQAGLAWQEDESNADERFDRNYLRRVVLPLIQVRWPAAAASVSRSARHAAEAQRLLDALARADVDSAADGADLSVAVLRGLPAERRRNAVRYWIARAGLRAPDAKRLQELTGPVLEARIDSKPSISWPGAQIRRHAGRLCLQALPIIGAAAAGTPSLPRGLQWEWHAQPRLELPDGSTLELQRDRHGPIALDKLPAVVTVRWRTGGERIRIIAGANRRALKSLLQEAAVPPELRARLPLLFSGEHLLAVGSSWLDASIQATATCSSGAQPRGRLRWSA
jgi:tRNA(Ile)-lysidine synthase